MASLLKLSSKSRLSLSSPLNREGKHSTAALNENIEGKTSRTPGGGGFRTLFSRKPGASIHRQANSRHFTVSSVVIFISRKALKGSTASKSSLTTTVLAARRRVLIALVLISECCFLLGPIAALHCLCDEYSNEIQVLAGAL